MLRISAALVSLALLLPGPLAAPAGAQGPADASAQTAAQSDSLRAFLITFGPGAAVWERFGHNALWIHDPEARTDVAYHYGLFDMSADNFLLHFLQGRMWYSMGTAPAGWLMETYRQVGRDGTLQELRLTADQVRELQAFLEWNMRPENRVYRYDYFRDNCSTRIRDALDRVTGGTLRSTLESRPSPLTYRAQAVALTAEDALLTTGMDLGLGPLADQPISRWELAFIPMRLADDLRDITVDGDGLSLVASERALPAVGTEEDDAGVAPHETSTRGRAFVLLLVGLLIGGILAGAGWLADRRAPGSMSRRIGVWTLLIGGSTWGLVTGVLGLILLALWALTDHEFAWRNENLLQTNPLALGLVVLVPLALRTRAARDQDRGRTSGGNTAAGRLALVLLGLSILGLLLHPLPLTLQANLPIIALTLPIHAGLAWALRVQGNPHPTRHMTLDA